MKKAAKDLKVGDVFSYTGSFKSYTAQTDAQPHSLHPGKVLVLVTDGGVRNEMPTKLNADMVCTIHNEEEENK